MQLPLEYMLKMTLCLTAGYLFYYLLLRRITHYNWNRWYLLFCAVFSFIIPAVNINLFVEPQKLNNVFFINKLPAISAVGTAAATTAAPVTHWWDMATVLPVLFIAGVLVLALRLLIQYLSLKKIQAKAKLVGNGEVRLYHLDTGIAPFSFNNSIYVNRDMYSQQELEEVIRHELVHVRQKHTIDVLLAELVCIVNWYNPFAWMIKNAVKENLEFIADDNVLQYGINRKSYQYLLLKVTGNIPLAITNNLNFSSLKNRIVMMNKSKTSKLHLFKFIFIIPLACVLLLAFRQANDKKEPAPDQKKEQAADETFTLGTLTYSINNTTVEAIVKKDQENSFLKPGNVLSLSSIKNEKSRLAGLLNKNGYDTSGDHAIYFMVDTFSTNKSFSIQVTINVPPKKSVGKDANRLPTKTALFGGEENKLQQAGEIITGQNSKAGAYNNHAPLVISDVKRAAI